MKLKVSLHSFFIHFALVDSSNKGPVRRFWRKNALVLLLYPVLVVEEVVEEVGGEEQPDFGSYS